MRNIGIKKKMKKGKRQGEGKEEETRLESLVLKRISVGKKGQGNEHPILRLNTREQLFEFQSLEMMMVMMVMIIMTS